MGYNRIAALAACLAFAACAEVPPLRPAAAEEAPAAGYGYGTLADLAGTRWRGEPPEPEEGGLVDYSEWYWDLGGSVLVNRHVISDGSYGGVTYIQTTREPDVLSYIYVTSARFWTAGSFTLNEDGSWVAEEAVEGHPHVLKVRSTGRINADGTMSSASEFLGDDGEWTPGHAFTYSRTDEPMPELAPSGTAPE